MGRTLGMLLFCLSITAAAQVNVVGGYAVPQPTSVPLLSPPNVALPGSGTPTGAPPALGVNDLRNNPTGAIYTPGIGETIVGGQNLTGNAYVVSTNVNAGPANEATGQPFSAVEQRSGNAAGGNAPIPGNARQQQGGNQRPMTVPFGIMTKFTPDASRGPAAPLVGSSLGEVAAQLRAKKNVVADRNIVNADVNALGNRATFRGRTVELPQADQLPQGDAADQQGRSPQASDRSEGVLDQNDLRDVEAAVERSKQKQRQNQTAHPQNPEQPR
jgi:hypothetical protein